MDTLYILLRYGLFFGAIFQLVCLAAIIILPERGKSKENRTYGDLSDSESEYCTHVSRRSHNYHRPRKQEKKKRR